MDTRMDTRVDASVFNQIPCAELQSYEMRDLHYMLWQYLYETGAPEKIEFFLKNGFSARAASIPMNSCYACEWAKKQHGGDYPHGSHCKYCPIQWPDECYERAAWYCEHWMSPYNAWNEVDEDKYDSEEEEREARRQYAREMLDLEWEI